MVYLYTIHYKIIIPPLCCRQVFDLRLKAVKGNVEISCCVLSLKHAEDTCILNGIWCWYVAQLEEDFHFICTLIPSYFYPDFCVWYLATMPSQPIKTVVRNVSCFELVLVSVYVPKVLLK